MEKIADSFAESVQATCSFRETIQKLTRVLEEFQPVPNFMTQLEPADFVVSSLVTSEVARLVHTYINARIQEIFGHNMDKFHGRSPSVEEQFLCIEELKKFEKAHDRLMTSLPVQHIVDLSSLIKCQGSCYYADTTTSSYYEYNPQSKTREFRSGADWQKSCRFLPAEVFETVDELFSTKVKREWLWDFSPVGRLEDQPNIGVCHNVHARVLTHKKRPRPCGCLGRILLQVSRLFLSSRS